jgi:RNA polymerase sigma-70 factor, ECF subfamily
VSPEEFSDFYAASFRRLVGQLYLMTGDHAEAQDAVQEAFVRAWAHRGKLDRLGAPEAWVRATAWHIAVSRWQRARLGRLLTRSQARSPAVDGPTPDRVALIDGLRQVPAEQRRALVLYHLCDLTVAQIAEETGVTAGTVKARLARGRSALAPHLRDAGEPAGIGRPGPGGPDGGRGDRGSGPGNRGGGGGRGSGSGDHGGGGGRGSGPRDHGGGDNGSGGGDHGGGPGDRGSGGQEVASV